MEKRIKSIIEESMPDYSRIQKKLAEFILRRWNEIPLMSIETISMETGVSTATITRFVRQFDVSGFYQFKEQIKEDMKRNINPVETFELIDEDFSGKESLLKVAQQDVKNINRLMSTINEKTFLQLVEILEKANRIYTFGTSISSIFSRLMTYIFSQIQLEAHCLDEGDLSVEEKILTISKDEPIIFSSFYPYAKSTIQYAQLAKEQKLQVIGISDNTFSPISKYANLVLAIPRENILFTTSMAAFSVLINALATEIALKKKTELANSIKETDKALSKFYYLS